MDVRNPKELHEIVEKIADKHGRMDGMIAAAGINREIPALGHTMEDFEEVMSINVTGVFLCAQAAAQQMIKFGNGGSIVLIASMSGTIANKVRIAHPQVLSCADTTSPAGFDLSGV